MNTTPAIAVEDLYKKFCSNLKVGIAYGALDTCRTLLNRPYATDTLRKSEFWALEAINFEIRRGETFGLVGCNGSGKSTLLRIINGIFPPDRGRVTVRGRIGALIAVGAGFHPHMTGRENIFLNGAILGMSRRQIVERMDDIIDFADIGDFLDAPVSTYSSGMYVRLGFAIAIHGDPDIVLVDEVLAVGDAKFQRKCLDRIREMREQGVSFILVSHNMQNIEGMCDRALLLHKGKPLMVASPQEVAPAYDLILATGDVSSAVAKKPVKTATTDGELLLVKKYHGFGTDEVLVNTICLTNASGVPSSNFRSEEAVCIKIEFEAKIDIPAAKLWQTFIYVTDKEENNLVTMGSRLDVRIRKGKSSMTLFYPQAQLTTGRYKTSFHLFDSTFTNPYTQGHYGYFTVQKGIPTQQRVGVGTPMTWGSPELTIKHDSASLN
jgi:ABC-type polysaccharide/polyol phosphate transport system ATPase subunit